MFEPNSEHFKGANKLWEEMNVTDIEDSEGESLFKQE